jgi:hypothetical protein
VFDWWAAGAFDWWAAGVFDWWAAGAFDWWAVGAFDWLAAGVFESDASTIVPEYVMTDFDFAGVHPVSGRISKHSTLLSWGSCAK